MSRVASKKKCNHEGILWAECLSKTFTLGFSRIPFVFTRLELMKRIKTQIFNTDKTFLLWRFFWSFIFNRISLHITQGPECSATGMGQFPICKLKWDLLRTSVTACTIDKNTFSAPFGIFHVRTEIWKEIFQKKSYKTP